MIILNEIKKIFELKAILLLALITFVIYHLSISFYIDNFPNGRPELDIYNVSVQMLKDYGTYMDDAEFANFKEIYDEKVKEADKYLQGDKDAIKAKITNYKEFRNKHGDFNSKIMFEEQVDLFWELEGREWLVETYENKENSKDGLYQRSSQKQMERVKEVIESDNINSILPETIIRNYINYMKNVSFLILLSIMFMISPIYLRDKRNDLDYIQYSCKIGRKLFKKKVIAGLISSFIIISIQLVLFMYLYSFNETHMFFNAHTSSIFNMMAISWYDITFIQYIILTILGVYLLGFIIALIVIFISSIVPNYISVIGIQIPLVFVNGFILIKYLILRLLSIDLHEYFAVITYTTLFILSILLVVTRWRREKVVDIAH